MIATTATSTTIVNDNYDSNNINNDNSININANNRNNTISFPSVDCINVVTHNH